MPDLNLQPIFSSSSFSKQKHIPTPSLLSPWQFDYLPSPDGHDSNLLIMFHGLGDTKSSFSALGRSLNLPSTAVLSLQAPTPYALLHPSSLSQLMVDRLPWMSSPAWSWYNTFTPLFEPLPHPDPTPSLPALRKLLDALTSPEVGWETDQIHLFGWGQGGTIALELACDLGKTKRRLGSVISVCAGLFSHPSTKMDLETPVLYFTRSDVRSWSGEKVVNSLKRAFKEVEVVRGDVGRGEDMPRGRGEWEGIMRFWARLLGRADKGWKGEGEVYEVVR